MKKVNSEFRLSLLTECSIHTKAQRAMTMYLSTLRLGTKLNFLKSTGAERLLVGKGKYMSEVERLKSIVEKLRSEDGCPWDKAQTHESLKAGCIEEASEVISGINILEKTGDADNLKEELGDLLLQIMFHSVMAEEEGLFTFEDVAKTISDKMVRRHPHVFGDMKFATEEELHEVWAEIKRKEKEGKEWQADYLPEAFNEAEALIQKARERKGF